MRRGRLTAVALLAMVLCAPVMGEDLGAVKKAVSEMATECQSAMDDMNAKLDELRESEKYKESIAAGDYDTVRNLHEKIRTPVVTTWREKFTAAKEEHVGTEAELLFVEKMLEHRLVEDFGGTMRRLLESHPESELLLPFVKQMMYISRSVDRKTFVGLVDTILEKNPLKEIQGYALYARATATDFDRNLSDYEKMQAAVDRRRILDLVDPDSLLGRKARGPEFEKNNLQIGQKAPDIVGTDLDGYAMKLSDYAGKVIVLDFWGHW